MNTIGERIKEIRKINKLNQLEFAEILGKKQGVISQIERNETSITIESLIIICEKFNLSADWIIFGKTKEMEPIEDNKLSAEGQKMLNEYIEYLKSKYPIEDGKEYDKKGNLWYPGDGEKIS